MSSATKNADTTVALSELTITYKRVLIRQWKTLAVPDTYFLKIGYRQNIQNLWKFDEHIYLGNKFILSTGKKSFCFFELLG